MPLGYIRQQPGGNSEAIESLDETKHGTTEARKGWKIDGEKAISVHRKIETSVKCCSPVVYIGDFERGGGCVAPGKGPTGGVTRQAIAEWSEDESYDRRTATKVRA